MAPGLTAATPARRKSAQADRPRVQRALLWAGKGH